MPVPVTGKSLKALRLPCQYTGLFVAILPLSVLIFSNSSKIGFHPNQLTETSNKKNSMTAVLPEDLRVPCFKRIIRKQNPADRQKKIIPPLERLIKTDEAINRDANPNKMCSLVRI